MNLARRLLKLECLSALKGIPDLGSSFSTATAQAAAGSVCKINNHDKILFTPGPLMTTKTVKEVMLRDIGVGDVEFKQIVDFIQKKLLQIAGVLNENNEYVAILLQGSGTYSIEALIQQVSNGDSNCLIIENGLYGKKLAQICERSKIRFDVKSFPENRSVDVKELDEFLRTCKPEQYTHVGMIHGETSSGVLNQIERIGPLIKKYLPNSTTIVDSISCFGAVDVNLKKSSIDFLVCSSNKCIQSVPGIAFVVGSKAKLFQGTNCSQAKTLSLDLIDQYEVDIRCKLFRFTPPTHVILALKQALIELDECGGPAGRYKLIQRNHEIIYTEMTKLGFKSYIPLSEQSKVVNTFMYPSNEKFVFEKFQTLLREKGKILYSRSLTTSVPTFRIGNIGNLSSSDMYSLIDTIKQVLTEMGLNIPVSRA